MTIDLGEHFDVVSQGHHWIAGVLWLPGGTSNPPIQDVIYRDPFIWPYQALETTPVHVHTWGSIKEAVTYGAEGKVGAGFFRRFPNPQATPDMGKGG